MKKLTVVLSCFLLLQILSSGCSAKETMRTVETSIDYTVNLTEGQGVEVELIVTVSNRDQVKKGVYRNLVRVEKNGAQSEFDIIGRNEDGDQVKYNFIDEKSDAYEELWLEDFNDSKKTLVIKIVGQDLEIKDLYYLTIQDDALCISTDLNSDRCIVNESLDTLVRED